MTDTSLMAENELGRYPKEPNLLTLNVNFSGVLLTSQLAEESWESSPSTGNNRQLILLASMGKPTCDIRSSVLSDFGIDRSQNRWT